MGIDLMTGVRMTFEETLKCVIREDNVNIIGNSKDSKQLYFLYEPLTGLYKMGRGLDWWKRVSSLMKKWVYKSIKLSDVIYVVECESAWKAQAIEDAFEARCSFCDMISHSRMPLVPTHFSQVLFPLAG